MKFLTKAREKKNGKKGFTLVELIVVLVILAILMAILIPAMTGWITKAKDKAVMLEARTAYLACQTVASEQYAKTPIDGAMSAEQITEATALASVKGTIDSATVDKATGTVSAFKYTDTSGRTCELKADGWYVNGKLVSDIGTPAST